MPLPAVNDIGTADSIESYIRLVLEKRPQGSSIGWFFRGQRHFDWELLSQIDRPAYVAYRGSRGWSRRDHEERLLGDFRLAVRLHVSLEPRTDWEWLAVAQHHGLATRLLDWTANPLAALFFAIEEECAGDAAVWCYHHNGKSWTDYLSISPLDVVEIIEFRPAHLTPRITVQGGCFTVHPDEHASAEPCYGDLRRIRVPDQMRRTFRRELRELGIDRASLFPDLDGIALALNRHLSGHDAG